jgi:hypothetical protein
MDVLARCDCSRTCVASLGIRPKGRCGVMLDNNNRADYQRLRDCAAHGCDRTREDGHLERISPKGKGCPFVGLCRDHYGRSVVLKAQAAELLGGR